MTNRLLPLEDAFPRRSRPLLAAGLVVGDPFPEATRRYMDALVAGGAEMVELIVPFSDPHFHGPVLRRACHRAMSEKIRWTDVEELVADFRIAHPDIPVMVTSYFNRILARGEQPCLEGLSDAGADGVLVIDLPAEEGRSLRRQAEERELFLIQAVAPTTSLERFRKLEQQGRGFMFWTGHCGAEMTIAFGEFRKRVRELRKQTTLPIIASTNVESGDDAAQVVQAAHGVLVSSSVAWLIEGGGPDVEQHVEKFVAELRSSIDAEAGI